jgi:Family of unknown function (DUF5686)/CarboxypepD_reg-like domain
MQKLLLLGFLLIAVAGQAQKITGTVFNSTGDLLPYASVTVKGTSQGASANNKAKYSISLTPGTYTLVCQHIGYTRQEKTITVGKQDEEVVFILTDQKLQMKEVVVTTGGEDPAYQIIRNAIKKRNYYGNQVNSFECDVYTKDLIKLRSLPKSVFGQKIEADDKKEMGVDSAGKGIIYLSESIAKVHAKQPDKFKMEVLSSRVSGSSGFGFSFPTFISLYKNNVTVFTERLNPRGFVSPIADGAIGFYKFKYLGSFWEDGKEINSIRVTPRRSYEPLFTGTINITEGDWRIHSFDLTVTKKSQLEILDTLQLTQIHVPVGNDVWRVKNQLIHFNFNFFKIDAIGNFVSVYSQYNINPEFPKKFFDNVIIKYDTAVNKRPKTYWDTIRPVPLEPEEAKDYQVKDSIYQYNKDSVWSKRDIDSLRKKQGSINPKDLFWGGINRRHYSKKNPYNWGIRPLLPNLQYNSVEGIVLNVQPYFNKYLRKWKQNLSIEPTIRYGLNNTHLNAYADVIFRSRDWDTDKKLKRETWRFSGGKRVTQFNNESPITPLANTISTLWGGKNYMKIYENWYGSAAFSKRYENGLSIGISALFEDRMPLENTTNYTFVKKDTVHFTPNYPYEKIATQFSRHQALQLSFNISIKPGQKYIQFPRSKVAIGSDYPTFSFNYTKGIKGLLGSDVDFDKWRFSISDDKNFKLAGLLKYKLSVGGFINTNKVYIQDYQHFNGNRFIAASEYVNSFQLAKYYAYSNTNSFFALGHIEHHFNGLLTNKIPLFKRLNWNLVGGSNGFYVNKTNNYFEVFGGIENIFKVLRIDVVTGFEYGRKGFTALRLGAGGLIGGSVKANRGDRTVSISL